MHSNDKLYYATLLCNSNLNYALYKPSCMHYTVIYHHDSVKRYQESKIGTVFQFGIAVRLQYCDNWQFGIHNAA